ncbi:putative Sulfotransferase domain, P-loop containing nucleoside triphosphate hydrolase [Helianthus annuus]|nr:putative Sulfotransferase domain, P-loop containing nucleoside triphosphate hydrolase [Helianthus annuus]
MCVGSVESKNYNPLVKKILLMSFVTTPGLEDYQEEANLALIFDKYKDKFTTFPKEKGWMTEELYKYQGFWHQSKNVVSVETVMATQDTFQALPTDIYLATLPKSGTTWLKALVFSTVNRNMYKNKPLSSHPLQTSNPHNCLPFVECEVLKTSPTYVDAYLPRLFATHMPYTSLPQSILDSRCRIVYMCRNPKDVLVSLFHFANNLRGKSQNVMTFEEAFEMFTKGVIPNGPYWDHVKGYYKIGLEQPTKIMFLTYEDMKMDTPKYLRRLAKFLGYPFTEEEEAKGMVEDIVSLCSFDNLSKVNKHGSLSIGIPNYAFFREGKVGDWRKHLTTEMSETLDQITKEKFDGLDLVLTD